MQNFELRRVVDFAGQFKLIFKRREKRIATFHLAFDQREVKIRTPRQCLRINLRAAADENVIGKFAGIQFVQRVENQDFRLLYFPSLLK